MKKWRKLVLKIYDVNELVERIKIGARSVPIVPPQPDPTTGGPVFGDAGCLLERCNYFIVCDILPIA